MKHMKLRNTLSAAAVIGGTIAAANALADAPQGGSGPGYGTGPGMMGGYGVGWMEGYGGIGLPILLVIVVAGLVAWFVSQKRK